MLSLIVLLVVVGFALYLIGLIPMDATMLKVIRALVILVVIVYVLQALGVLGGLPRLR